MIRPFDTANCELLTDTNQTYTLINSLSLKIKLIFSNTIPYSFFCVIGELCK